MIRPHLPQSNTFEPDAIAAMSRALEEACVALNVFAGDERGRQVIATRIIDLAIDGVTDPSLLRDRVISEAKQVA